MQLQTTPADCRARAGFCWATIWMLTCAELIAAKREHISRNEFELTVTLKFPLSKMDQIGWGVRCTLSHVGLLWSKKVLVMCMEGLG